jgi:hypothetical protein
VTPTLAELLARPDLWRGQEGLPPTVPTGHKALDNWLPGGGWPAYGLIELIPACLGLGELTLLLPALRVLEAKGWIVWVAPPHVPYAPALAGAGLEPARHLVVYPETMSEVMWAAEQTLRARVVRTVLIWLEGRVAETGLRRLQLASAAGATLGIAFRSPKALKYPSPAALRVMLRCNKGGLCLQILKSRGGRPGCLTLANTGGIDEVDGAGA